jgi:4-hydroxybenzoate polyprenyltransferase
MPWAIYLAADATPPAWLYLALALFTTAFHFLNVVKDLQWDLDQGVLGLPQRLGKRDSITIAVFLAISGVLVLLFLP